MSFPRDCSVAAIDISSAIVCTLRERLEETWRQFLDIQQVAAREGQTTPSTTPCSPAPSRQLFILRDDVQAVPSGMFLSFEGILSSGSNAKANPYEKHSLQRVSAFQPSIPSPAEDRRTSAGGGKRKWSLLRSIMPFTSTLSGISDQKAFPSPSGHLDISSPARPHTSGGSSNPLANDNRTDKAPVVPYRTLSFKFSLEWVDKKAYTYAKERHLSAPKLPPLAEAYAKRLETGQDLHRLCKPNILAPGHAKYAGRALAEWNLLVTECRNFLERRRAEGVPSFQMVEIPSLSVEPFRKS